MRRLLHTIFAIALLACLGIAEIRSPRIGMQQQPDGRVRPIYGVTANLIYGKPWDLTGVVAAAFSDRAGLLLAGNRLMLLALDGRVIGSVEIPETHPLLDIEDTPESAAAWLPSSGRLLTWDGRTFAEMQIDTASLPAAPSAFRIIDNHSIEFLVNMPDASVVRATVSRETGAVTQFVRLPGITGPAFQFGSFVIGRQRDRLVIETAGLMRVLPVSDADVSLQRVASNWLAVTSNATGRQWLIHVDNTGIETSELPRAAAPPSGTGAHEEGSR